MARKGDDGMFRKINKDKSIFKILMYSIILTWFVFILIENWNHMRVSWFREVWQFVDLKAVLHYIDYNISMWIFGAGFIIVPCCILFSRDKSTPGMTSFEECQKDWDEQQAASERSNPAYDFMPCNVSYRAEFEKREKH
jgi:hypothetical protein